MDTTATLSPPSFSHRIEAYVDRGLTLLDEIRRAATFLRNKHGYTLGMLEQVSGVHKNSLLKLTDPEWRPKMDTLQHLASLVERAQAHRRGETFSFPGRRGPGRPRGSKNSRPRRKRKAKAA
jgi:hypothetical protein